MATKPDAILIAPTDVKAMQAPLAAAAKSGIKIVLVDTTMEDPSYAVSQVSSDNVGGGAAAFAAIQKLAPNGGKVLVISIDPGVSTVDARVKGFEDAVKADSKYTYLGVQYSHNDPATAASAGDGGAAEGHPTSSASSPPTCSRRRARPPVSSRPARRARSRWSASTPGPTRSRP